MSCTKLDCSYVQFDNIFTYKDIFSSEYLQKVIKEKDINKKGLVAIINQFHPNVLRVLNIKDNLNIIEEIPNKISGCNIPSYIFKRLCEMKEKDSNSSLYLITNYKLSCCELNASKKGNLIVIS